RTPQPLKPLSENPLQTGVGARRMWTHPHGALQTSVLGQGRVGYVHSAQPFLLLENLLRLGRCVYQPGVVQAVELAPPGPTERDETLYGPLVQGFVNPLQVDPGPPQGSHQFLAGDFKLVLQDIVAPEDQQQRFAVALLRLRQGAQDDGPVFIPEQPANDLRVNVRPQFK